MGIFDDVMLVRVVVLTGCGGDGCSSSHHDGIFRFSVQVEEERRKQFRGHCLFWQIDKVLNSSL